MGEGRIKDRMKRERKTETKECKQTPSTVGEEREDERGGWEKRGRMREEGGRRIT